MNTDQLCQWGEHVAASWFIKEGYNVLFPRSKTHAEYDFVIENGGRCNECKLKPEAQEDMGNLEPRVIINQNSIYCSWCT